MKLTGAAVLFSFILFQAVLGNDDDQFTPIVQLKSGKVRGLVQEVGGQQQHFYQGIRYGTAKRFSSPTFASSWTDVWNATKTRDSCPQPLADPATQLIQGEAHSEDCLFLNIWAPANATKHEKKLPVMVWIHGGAFTIGTIFALSVDGKDLAAQGNIVLVAINYRLGPFGFLYTGKEANFGLQDQILALKWVKENIAAFGGDPTMVTVAGESAGGQAIGSLIISPLAAGLFRRAILQSGAPNSGFIGTGPAIAKTVAFAAKFNCSNADISASVECLRKRPLDELVNGTSFTLGNDHFYPIHGDAVLPLSHQEALKTGKFNQGIDLLYGVCNNEGSYFARSLFPKYLTKEIVTRSSASVDIAHTLALYNQSQFAAEVADLYLSKLPANFTQDQIKMAVASAIGDHRITCPTILMSEAVAKHSKNSSSNIAMYSYRLLQHFQFPGFPTVSWGGVAHAEDLPYLFLVSFLSSEADKQLSGNMIRAWANFAATGHPGSLKSANSTIQWTPALGPNNQQSTTTFMSLLADGYQMVPNYYQTTCEAFWKPKLFA